MVLYEYICYDCGKTKDTMCPMGSAPESMWCDGCDKAIGRNYSINVFSFRPYIDKNFNGKSVEVTSAKHRDELCKEHGVTYDSAQYQRRQEAPSAAEHLTYGDIKKELDNVSDDELRKQRDDARRDCMGGEIPTVQL